MSDQPQQPEYEQPALGQPGYDRPIYGRPYPALPQPHPQGTVVLVLGILGCFVTVCAPIAWYLGSKALREIQASGARYSNEDLLRAGRIIGMIVTILAIVGLVFLVIFVIIAAIAATATSS